MALAQRAGASQLALCKPEVTDGCPLGNHTARSKKCGIHSCCDGREAALASGGAGAARGSVSRMSVPAVTGGWPQGTHTLES